MKKEHSDFITTLMLIAAGMLMILSILKAVEIMWRKDGPEKLYRSEREWSKI
jgi:hypothetical protein